MTEEYKVLDRGFIRVIDKMGNDNSIVQAARISYSEGTKTFRQDKRLIEYLYRHKHTSPFEMCEIKLHIKMPIFIARQWVRHRTASINEYSGRYSIMKSEFYFPDRLYGQHDKNKQSSSNITLTTRVEHQCLNLILDTVMKCNDTYHKLLEEGVSRETARMVLPLNTYTEIYWKIDLHNLLKFITLRLDETAQSEIRAYADIILNKIVKPWVPSVYEAYKKC